MPTPIAEAPICAPQTFDCAIVLGAMVRPDGTPSPALARRVARAAALALDGQAANLLMSGGPVSHPLPEARMMARLAEEWGVEAARIHVEEQSRNTIGNARLSAPIIRQMGWSRLALVTDSFHLPRALYVFRRFGLRVRGIGARPDQPKTEWWLAHIREAAALPWTVIRVERAMWKE